MEMARKQILSWSMALLTPWFGPPNQWNWFWTSKTVSEYIFGALSYQLCGNVLQQPPETNTTGERCSGLQFGWAQLQALSCVLMYCMCDHRHSSGWGSGGERGLLWSVLLHCLGLCFVHSCFRSLPVCGKFAPAVRLTTSRVYFVGKVFEKLYRGRSRHSLESGAISN